jgi:hypothetical protein
VVFVKDVDPVILFPSQNDRVGDSGDVPPPLLDSFTGIFIQATTTPNVMRLGAFVAFKVIRDILYFFDDRLFRQVIIVMKYRSAG